MVVDRKYASVRLERGDYIQPSNDAKALWRIYSYEEDDMAGTFWATAKYDRPFHNQGEWQDPDFLEWGNWLTWETGFRTKKAALEAALRVS